MPSISRPIIRENVICSHRLLARKPTRNIPARMEIKWVTVLAEMADLSHPHPSLELPALTTEFFKT